MSETDVVGQPAPKKQHTGFDMEILVGYILLTGVLLSMALILAGLIWRWVASGQLGFSYSISGMNLWTFTRDEIRQVAAGDFRPRLLASWGIIILLFTPYVRVLASIVYFAVAEKNLKYTLFTGFVLAVLTYALFLH